MSDQTVQRINGHEVVYESHRFTCRICGARLLQVMQFHTSECPGPRDHVSDQTTESGDHRNALRALWREAAEKGLVAGIDWPSIVLTLLRDIDRAETDAGLRERIEALIGGPVPPVFLSDRPNKIVRVQHRADRLAATVTESMVRVSDVVDALRRPPGEHTEGGDDRG